MQPEPILQGMIPATQRETAQARLPSMRPVAPGELLRVDEAYAAQLAEKARLIATRPGDVMALMPGAEAAAREALAVVLQAIAERTDFSSDGAAILCPDGRHVVPDDTAPLQSLSRLVQEDVCLLMPGPDGVPVLTGALLCFPAAWTLAEKLGRPLGAIHTPVPSYDTNIAARVERLFAGLRPGMALWRANLLRYDDPALYQPHAEARPRPVGRPESRYERSERQTLVRLPLSGAVMFMIHTTVCAVPPFR
ncbi:MAG: DUF3445 domain-containing protein [Limimaricola sp.]|uniref:heme-dependent oxidative N-demethylase family protein n=1 Tax=Limimaricola sp. TaxID=2211665 RepID=UPI001D6A16DA|nr:DUF3445 domain-containing protein [Limimaricola sp.]MBI1416657.1 DUF3445 domain-containing protein [Limimaricola sp.]